MNVYIIGMPGVGKSKTGHYLSSILEYDFVDLDQEIIKMANMSAEEIFAQKGEDYFRVLETRALEEISKKDNLVVSTGGGIVTRKENKAILRHGLTFFLNAPLDLIKEHLASSSHARPLLKTNSLEKLYKERYKLYLAFADYTVNYLNYNDASKKIAATIKKEAKKNILVIEGPNLNLLGKRNHLHYGTLTLDEIHAEMAKEKTFNFTFFFSNHEGQILDMLDTYNAYDAIIINPAALTHTSLALHDCLEVIDLIKVEVHLSEVDKREPYRQINFVRDVVDKTFQGGKLQSYLDAISYLKTRLNVL